ncbi:MAG: glycosyltransferase family 2 protein [Candidatus Binatia bacterium]
MNQKQHQSQDVLGRTSSSRIVISIIVPVYNNPQDLHDCLSAILSTSGPDSEIIVVDDASTDNTSSVAARMGVTVLRLTENSGPAAARNYGASHARGEILFFVDADVVVAPETIERVVKVMENDPDLAAVFGSYDAQPRAPGVISQYRNLLHHFVHQNGNSEASTFWAGCGAIRRTVFEKIGGFDQKQFRRPSIEDIELGYRMRQAGYRILLDKSIQGTHLKQWTLFSYIRTDIVCRAVPWSQLIIKSKTLPNDLNLKWDQRASFVLVALGYTFLALSVLQIEMIAMSAAALSGVLVLNRRMYLFFFRQRGLPFTLACIPLHTTYYLYSGLSYLYVRGVLLLRGAAIF